MKRITALLTALVLAIAVTACGTQEVEELQSIAGIAAGDAQFSTLVDALTEAGLVDTFADDDAGPFTVFAPTNAAFSQFLSDAGLTGDQLLASPELGNILRYHVLDGEFLAADVVAAAPFAAPTLLAGASIDVAVVGGGVLLDCRVNVVTTDIEASNGVIHVIDYVLDPNAADLTIAEIAACDDAFSSLVGALTDADLVSTFADADAGPFTVFAPTNAAFAAIADVLPTLTDDEILEILRLHVIAGEVSSTDAIDAFSARSLDGELLYFIVDGDDLRVDDVAVVTAADVQASNGVIHVIDAVLLPKGTIADAVVARAGAAEPQFQTLLQAIQEANEVVLNTLGDVDAGPFTVFAPTDDAFAAIDEATLNELLADQAALTDVLLYHVTDAGALLAAQVVALVAGGPEPVAMLNGDDVTVSLVGDSVLVNGATVVVTDVLTANGVIHVIDAVLFPPPAPTSD
jgi:transforming growth factor-beta-induced protein